LTIVTLLALCVEFRTRIALALDGVLGLAWLQQRSAIGPSWHSGQFRRSAACAGSALLAWVGKRSLLHFPDPFPSLPAVQCSLGPYFSGATAANALGMLAAFGVSVLGALLYRGVERRDVANLRCHC
jgi:hypothetical protein